MTALLEMFPYSCSLEVTHCINLTAGDVEAAAQLIMHRHESGQSLRPSDRRVSDMTHFVKFIIKEFCVQMKKHGAKVDDKTMKNLIVGKYGFVDKEDDTRYHRPTLRRDVSVMVTFNQFPYDVTLF